MLINTDVLSEENFERKKKMKKKIYKISMFALFFKNNITNQNQN